MFVFSDARQRHGDKESTSEGIKGRGTEKSDETGKKLEKKGRIKSAWEENWNWSSEKGRKDKVLEKRNDKET